MPKIAINTSIFGHILLDSELGGRFGVQGNTFKNTLGYLNQYFQTLSLRPVKLDRLAAATEALVIREDAIHRLDSSHQTTSALAIVCCDFATDIMTSGTGSDFMLPGGWSNDDGSGHGMIYQFQKQPDGSLLFSIYNAGAGREYHEKLSSTSNERFFPVKAYILPAPISSNELSILLSRLILPMLPAHPDRNQQSNQKSFDATTLYQNIEKSMPFLNALPVDAAKRLSANVTTAGQISGTCVQRSIHQMLKTNFGTLADYQRFIFDFKLYALSDFIKTHTPPRSRVITGLIQDAIINNLEILKQPQVFNDPEEQDSVVHELIRLQTLIAEQEAGIPTRPGYTPTPASFCLDIKTSPMNTFNEDALPPETASSTHPSVPILDGTCLLENLNRLILRCEELKDSDPMWVMEQIEQAIIRLPLPTRPIKHSDTVELTDFYDDIPFYSEIKLQTQLEDMGLKIEQLQQLYRQVTATLLNQTPLPHHLVIQCSLLALRDYFDVQQAKQHQKPSFHNAINTTLGGFLGSFRDCPYTATNVPDVDRRLMQLMSLYQFELRFIQDERNYYIAYYNALLDTEPALKEELRRLYNQTNVRDFDLNQALVGTQLTEVYVLFKELGANGEIDSMSTLPRWRFQALINKIQQQVRLERCYVACFNPFQCQPKTLHTTLKVEMKQYARYGSFHAEFKTLGYTSGMHIIDRYDDKLTRNKYNLDPSPAKDALMEDYPRHCYYQGSEFKYKLPGNEIQLSSKYVNANHIINKDDLYTRQLLHLRSSPSNQINFTLDYFQGQLSKLNDPNNQRYVEANIFEPGLLMKAIDEDPALLVRFDAFIQKGLLGCTNQDLLLDYDAIFFIRMRVYLHRYAAQYKPELALQDLKNDQNHLRALIATHTDPAMLASLHAYRFLAVIALQQMDAGPKDDSLFKEAFHSYFYIQAKANPHTQDDTATRFERQRAEYCFRQWMQTIPQEEVEQRVRPLIKPIMDSLGLDVTGLTLTGTHPLYTWENGDKTNVYTVNAETGRVFKANKTYSVVPYEVQTHPIMRRLGLEHESSCFIWADNNTFEFITSKMHVRIKREGRRLIVQRQWTLNGNTDWYELQPLTLRKQQLFGLGSNNSANFSDKLPALFTDGSTEAWVNSDKEISFITRNQQPIYQQIAAGELEQLDSRGNGTGFIMQACQHDVVHFEDPAFISVNVDKATGKDGTVNFARYGLLLTVRDENITLTDTNYTLLPSVTSPLGPDVAALHFTDGTNELCIVAVQPFYVDAEISKNEEGDYYRLKHDNSGHVAGVQLNELWKETSLATKDQPLWHYEGSATTISYKLVDGVSKPDTAADALYLCYVYLGTHEIDKAWALLDDLNQRLSLDGSMQELTYLSWIINSLPVILDPKKEKDATLKTPRYIACQLKALACFTDFLAQGMQPAIPIDPTFDLTKANGHYQALCFKQTKVFYDGLPGTIYTLYTQFQIIGRHLEKKHTLPDAVRKSLLNYYDPEVSKERRKALGSLGFEKRRLSLKTLLAEHNRLLAIQTSAPATFPDQFAKRLAHIDEHLARLLPVMKKSTVLALIPIDLSMPGCITSDRGLFTSQIKLLFSSWTYEADRRNNVFETKSTGTPEQAMDALSSAINEYDFMLYFPRYIEIASDAANAGQIQLLKFCQDYLKGHRHVPLDKQSTNVPYLTHVLYRLLHNPQCYKDNDSYKHNKKLPLDELTHIVKRCQVPAIEVYQAKDVFQEILVDSHDLWQALKQTTPVPVPMTTPKNVKPSLVLALSMGIDCTAYARAEIDYQDALDRLLAGLPQMPVLAQLREAEQTAGELKYTCIQSQRKIARSIFGERKTRTDLQASATEFQTTLKNDLEKYWGHALTLANQTSEDPELARRFRIEIAAGRRYELTANDLRKLYLCADCADYIEKTGLSIEQCDALHASLHQCVALDVQHQHVTRLLDALQQAETSSDPAHWDQIASILMSDNLLTAQTDPGLMLFQYEENILLRPRQVEALTNLLSTPDDPYRFKESIEKVIMGGGKSKVILPLLAAKKATGLNLVVVEVPRALLATNHVDLNSISQRLFNQKAHRFEFDRDSDCSSRRLEQIYQQFVEIMTNKAYLVTTGEAMQSLELKYLELLLSRPEAGDNEQWRQQVLILGKITGLLKQCGDVVIDEVHQGLLLKKKLNYTLGTPYALSPDLIHHSIMLYKFAGILGQTPVSPDSLIDHPQSPLRQYIEQLHVLHGDDVLLELRDYLNNKADSNIMSAASPALRDAFAFYKEQLTLLPQTQSRHYKEHYGPSRQISKSPLERMLAIPYAANEKPNERSRFGNPLETVNYTIQGMLQGGLNEDLLVDLIKQWQREARSELQQNFTLYQQMDQTLTAQAVGVYLGGTGFSLKDIDPDNEKQINILLKHLRHNKALLFDILERQVLPQVTTELQILHSDAYNHADIYHTRQGLSGTPWNHSTYHQDLQFNHKTSLGTDGYIQAVLKGNLTPVRAVEFTDCDKYLTTLFQDRKDIRAIIDISATFAGFTNLDVANELAVFARMHQTPARRPKRPRPPEYREGSPESEAIPRGTRDDGFGIKYVLYFNDADVLCALDVGNQKHPPIVLATSDPDEINRKLNCKPDDRLTYYDQSHTIGTDLKQAPNSRGLVLVNEKTHLQSFLQGCMRMRGLDAQQTVEIIVPNALRAESFDDLINTMADNEQKQLAEDNFYAAIAKMENVVRQDFLKRLRNLDEDDIETKYQWAMAFQGYFVEIKPTNLFEQYGAIARDVSSKLLLEQHRTRLLDDWGRCLGEICGSWMFDEKMPLEKAMQSVIDKSWALCKPNSMSRAKQGSPDLEVELKAEIEKLKEQKQLVEGEHFDRSLRRVDDNPHITQALCQGYYGCGLMKTSLGIKEVLREAPQRMIKNYPAYVLCGLNAYYVAGCDSTIDLSVSNYEKLASVFPKKMDSFQDATKENLITIETLTGYNPKGITKTLNDLCQPPKSDEKSILFSANILASGNYSNVYQEQKNMLGFYLKPMHAILFRMDNGKLTACIVSNQDAERIKQHLDVTHYDNTWLSTVQHTKLAGNRPDAMMNNVDYLTLMEQLRFFSGDLNGLVEQKIPLFWMNEKASEKLAFFEQHIMPYRETTQSEFNRLKSALAKTSEGFVYITQHALDDLTAFEWERQFPEALPADVGVFQSLAKAFAFANQLFQIDTLSQNTFSQFLLPPAALSCLNNHLDLLMKQHVNLSERKAAVFLENCAKTNAVPDYANPKPLQASIEKLRIRACELIIKSFLTMKEQGTDVACYRQAQAALALHDSLIQLTGDYSKAERPDETTLSKSITEAIYKSSPILNEDDYLRPILYNILNALRILVRQTTYSRTKEFKVRLLDAKSEATSVLKPETPQTPSTKSR